MGLEESEVLLWSIVIGDSQLARGDPSGPSSAGAVDRIGASLLRAVAARIDPVESSRHCSSDFQTREVCHESTR